MLLPISDLTFNVFWTCIDHRKGKDDNDDNDASDLSNTKADEKELSDLPENNNLFEGDIVMDSRLRDAVLGRSKKAVVKGDIKWPHGVLVYDIEPDFLPSNVFIFLNSLTTNQSQINHNSRFWLVYTQ